MKFTRNSGMLPILGALAAILVAFSPGCSSKSSGGGGGGAGGHGGGAGGTGGEGSKHCTSNDDCDDDQR